MNAPIRKPSTHLSSRQELVDLIEATLHGELAVIELDAHPAPVPRYPIEVHAPGLDAPIPLVAQTAGARTHGAYPVVLYPSSPDQAHHLRSLLERLRTPLSGTVPSGEAELEALQARREPAVSHAQLAVAEPGNRATEDDPLLGTLLGGGRYRVEALIGAGGMGRVYLGRQMALARPVAIKVLDARFQADTVFAGRFHQEALAASQLDHPNVMRVHDFGQEPDGRLYLVMELLEGKSLADLLDETGPLSEKRVAAIMTQVCAALTAAHAQGVVHRDIKPDNIVIETRADDDGNPLEHVVVCDFGLAKLTPSEEQAAQQAAARRRLTVAGQIMGTPDYMSPEQCRGEPADVRSDIYACGVVLFEMCTGRVPFDAEAPMEVIGMHLMSPPPRPTSLNRDLDERLERIILRALAKQPDARYQTTRELRDALRELGLPLAMPTPQKGVPPTSSAPPPTRATPEAFAAVLRSSIPPGSGGGKRLDGLAREIDFGDEPNSLRPSRIPLDAEAVPASMRAHASSSLPPRTVDAHEVLPEARRYLWAEDGERRSAYTRLIASGLSGYWALVRARTERKLDGEARRLWTGALRALAARREAALADSLARIDSATERDVDLCEDLLTAIPERRDQAWVDQVDRFLDHPMPSVRRAALAARVRMGGQDLAQPLLGALTDGDPSVQRLATRAYRKLGGVGSREVAALAKIVGDAHAPDDLRAGAAIALVRADARGRAEAEIALLRAVEGRSASFIRRLGGNRPPEDGPLFLEAASRALLRLSGAAVRNVVEKRARGLKGEARQRLERVLAGG